MKSYYTLHDIDLFGKEADALRLSPEPGAKGMGVIVRDGSAVVDYLLMPSSEVPIGGLKRDNLMTDTAQRISTYHRLRKTLAPETPRERPTISVVICTKDRPDWLRRLLGSLDAQETSQAFETVVIDNNSDSAEVRDIAEAAGAVYVRETKTGLDFARNRALETATGDVIAFLDDDTKAEPEWLENLSRIWAENPDAGCVTGLILPMSLESEAHVTFEMDGGFRRALMPERHGKVVWKRPLHPCGPGEFGAGANMSLDRKFVLDIGGFDEALDTGRPLPGGGDIDMFYRVMRGGKKLIYDPGVLVRHDHRADMKVLQHQYYTWGLGFFAYLQKAKQNDPKNAPNLNQMGRWFWLYMARKMVRRLIGRDPRPMRMIWAEMYGGLKGRFGEYERSQARSQAIREAAE